MFGFSSAGLAWAMVCCLSGLVCCERGVLGFAFWFWGFDLVILVAGVVVLALL